jgi:transcriptional regulator with XRE-family HTH domain
VKCQGLTDGQWIVARPVPPNGSVAEIEDSTADRLAKLRKTLRLSAAQLCRETGFAANRWSQYESGARPITLTAANKLCDLYGVTLDWIFRGDDSGLPVHVARMLSGRALFQTDARAPQQRRAGGGER